MLRPFEQVLGGSLLDDASQVHDGDAVGELFDHGEIVRDQQQREPEPVFQVGQQVQDLGLHRHIQRGCRFVADQHRRLKHERPRDRHALALPARKLDRPLFREMLRQTDALQHRQRLVAPAGGTALPLHLERNAHRIENGPVRRERAVRVLEDRLHLARDLGAAHLLDRTPFDVNLSAAGRQKAERDARQRRLAATRLADDRDRLIAVQTKRHASHGMENGRR